MNTSAVIQESRGEMAGRRLVWSFGIDRLQLSMWSAETPRVRPLRIAENLLVAFWLAVSIGYLIAYLGFGRTQTITSKLLVADFGVLVVYFLTVPWAILMTRWRVAGRVSRAEYCPCTVCGYSLAGLARHSACPECGTAHDVTRLQSACRRDAWSRAAAIAKPSSHEARFGLIGAVALMGTFVIAAIVNQAVAGPFHWFVLMPCLIVAMHVQVGAARHSLRQRLIESRFLLCRHCGEDLSRAAAAGPCPRCGTAYERSVLRAEWRASWPAHWHRDVVIPMKRTASFLAAKAES